jgi:formylmethanofuran dehydrogenase subunit E
MEEKVEKEDNEFLLDLKENNTYLLLNNGMFSEVKSYTILIVTDKAYYIRTNDGLETVNHWYTKENISNQYKFIEDITEKFNLIEKSSINLFNKSEIQETEINEEVKPEYIRCHICKGFGTLPDYSSTGGTKICPACHGSKMIIDSFK